MTLLVFGISLTILMTSPVESHATAVGFPVCSGGAVACLITDNPPNPVTKDPNDGILLVWDEVQNYQLTEDLKVDRVADPNADFIIPDGAGYKIKAGTIVSSHYVQWDPAPRHGNQVIATMEFDSDIFAFITADQKMFDSDEQLGLPGINYNDFPARGLEGGDITTIQGNQVQIAWTATSPGDWTRLITAYSPGGAENEAPVAEDDNYIVDEDNVLNGNVLENDTDANDDALSASLVSSTTNGTVELSPDGTFTYTPDADYYGNDSFTYLAIDGELDSNIATVSITINPVNDAPNCSTPTSSIDSIWPPNHKMKSVAINMDTSDVDGDKITLSVTSILQDEEVNSKSDGNTHPDGEITDNNAVSLRAERDGTGDGRIYIITIEASDGELSCTGQVIVGVPHDKNTTPVDSIVRFDSTQ